MRTFEVHDSVRKGFRLSMLPDGPAVGLGTDKNTKERIYLPLGNSIAKWLEHPEDQGQEFRLTRAELDEKPHGLYLVREADDNDKALVILNRQCAPELGVTRVAEARGNFSEPTLIADVQGEEVITELYEFKKGDGLFISIPAAALGTTHPKRFKIWWDGEELQEELVVKTSRRGIRPRRSKVQEPSEPKQVPQKSHVAELRA